MQKLLVSLAVLLAAQSYAGELRAQDVYWIENNQIRHAPPPFTGAAATLYTHSAALTGLSVDTAHGYAFATSLGDTMRIDLTSGAMTVLAASVSPMEIAADPATSQVFWISSGNLIWRAGYLGPGKTASVAASCEHLAVRQGKVYWSSVNAIYRANFDGSESEVVVNFDPVGAFVFDGDMIYWVHDTIGGEHLFSASLSGSLPIAPADVTTYSGAHGLPANSLALAPVASAMKAALFTTSPSAGSPLAVLQIRADNSIAFNVVQTPLDMGYSITSAAYDGCGADSDGDGTSDCSDQCPSDPGKIAPGQCGCGTADTDSDSDGTPDCIDQCPADPTRTVPGADGCGAAGGQPDADGDGTPDVLDGCPLDPNKTAGGQCGCGVSDIDSDADGQADCRRALPAPVLTPDTLPAGPSVVLAGSKVYVRMEAFSGVSLDMQSMPAALSVLPQGGKQRKLSYRYIVVVSPAPLAAAAHKAGKIVQRISRKNQVVFRRLPPGGYSVRYRMQIRQGKRVAAVTAWSASTSFAVPAGRSL